MIGARPSSYRRPALAALLAATPFLLLSASQAADRPTGSAGILPATATSAVSSLPASVPSATVSPDFLVARIPPRPAGARTGSQFVAYVRGMDGATRERAILSEILSGNIPAFLRSLKRVELQGGAAGRAAGRAELWVMPDYLAIGSDDDFVRFPASFETASAVARRFGFALPTTRVVDAIYDQAELRLAPQTMKPGPAMTSTAYFEQHEEKIQAQTWGRAPGALTAGHKKDYVVTGRLAKAQTQEAIYGWHRGEGKPIQPLSLVHGSRYADYSHGVRLVAETVYLDGQPRSYYELLGETHGAGLLSREGVIHDARGLLR